ncbi:MAG: VOC family protein [Bacteroidota bacterium]
MSVSYLPEGHNQVSPYLMVESIENMFAFLTEVFDAEIIEQMSGDDGFLRHGEVRIGDSVIMMGRSRGEYKAMESMVHIYLPDAKAAYDKAIALGASSLMEPTDQFYGNREAGVRGPQGNQWWIATRIEILSEEEMRRRAANQP